MEINLILLLLVLIIAISVSEGGGTIPGTSKLASTGSSRIDWGPACDVYKVNDNLKIKSENAISIDWDSISDNNIKSYMEKYKTVITNVNDIYGYITGDIIDPRYGQSEQIITDKKQKEKKYNLRAALLYIWNAHRMYLQKKPYDTNYFNELVTCPLSYLSGINPTFNSGVKLELEWLII